MSGWYIKNVEETRDGLKVTFRRDGPSGADVSAPEEISGLFTKWITRRAVAATSQEEGTPQ